MFGAQHLVLSLFTASLIILPLLLTTGDLIFLIFPFAVAISSLIPDVDASDASIFHNKIRGTSRYFFGNRKFAIIINRWIGPLQPFFAKIAEWLVYKPYIFVLQHKGYNIKAEHRGIFHTLPAAALSAIIFSILLSILLFFVNSFNMLFVILFLLGFFLGFCLHLIEDSCTISGIDLLFPFKNYYFFRGIIETNPEKDQSKPNKFVTFLLILNITVIVMKILSILNVFTFPPIWLLQILVIIVVIVSWYLFIKWCGVKRVLEVVNS